MTGSTRRYTRRTAVLTVSVLAVVLFSGGFTPGSDGDYFLKVNKGIDMFGRVYREITGNYVDEIDPEKFMQSGIEGMLGTLDPYTVYIEKEDGDEVDLLTNGKYGGIGVTIGARDGAIEVISVMDGYSAQRQGMQPGDRILSVDGQSIETRKPDDVRTLTRGEPGTEVRLTVRREGVPQPIDFVLVREEIQIRNVTYSGLVGDGIAYIRLERFSRKAGDEVRQAIRDLKLRGEIKGVILDLRGNPGGLLDAAVDVVSKFVPKGSLIVSTRGRRLEGEKSYTSGEEPLLPHTPLALLTDRGSASASEIVAGAIQDLDRGIIVGTRTFGKGLVQTILPLNYGAQLKITTARYFIPSGRSIQEIDYMHKDRNGVFVITPDSLRKEFHTAHGRPVYELGGIRPDSIVVNEDAGPMVQALRRKLMFFRFANRYAAEHGGKPSLPITDAIIARFRTFLEEEHFDFQEESETRLEDLTELATRLHYSPGVLADLESLKVDLASEKARAFDRYRDHIVHELTVEFAARVNGEAGRIEASLEGDKQLDVAEQLLHNARLYSTKLALKP